MKTQQRQFEAIKDDITNTQNVGMEREDFVKFAIDFTEKLKDKWWSISFDERKGGEQTLFNGEFYIDSSAKVHTPNLSTIYTLGPTKKHYPEWIMLVWWSWWVLPPRPLAYLVDLSYRCRSFEES